jgi:hypothetical protein
MQYTGITPVPVSSTLTLMAARQEGKASGRRRSPGSLWREQAYLYDDEETALASRARKDRCSKAEVIRRALRAYLKIEE